MKKRMLDEIRQVLKEKEKRLDKQECLKTLQKASVCFEEMVQAGLVQKRGHQLIPIEKQFSMASFQQVQHKW